MKSEAGSALVSGPSPCRVSRVWVTCLGTAGNKKPALRWVWSHLFLSPKPDQQRFLLLSSLLICVKEAVGGGRLEIRQQGDSALDHTRCS